jgi:hypothetical protein
MLTGRVAFQAPTEYARLAAVLASEPEPLERVDPNLAPLAPFLQRALRKNRDERFPTALEMARALALAAPQAAQRADGSVGKITAAAALPLSRLPEVPSVFAPSVLRTPASAEAVRLASAPPTPLMHAPSQPPPRAPGGTLASPTPGQHVADPAPLVMMVQPHTLGETLPSQDLPIIARGGPIGGSGRAGVPAWAVVLLVFGALLAGFLLGWAAARMA